jgi:hypothetical protein
MSGTLAERQWEHYGPMLVAGLALFEGLDMLPVVACCVRHRIVYTSAPGVEPGCVFCAIGVDAETAERVVGRLEG